MRAFRFLLGAALAASAGFAGADDTDIYIDPSSPAADAPMIVFSIDYRSNLGNTVCSDARNSCPQADFFLQHDVTDGDVPGSGEKLTLFHVIRLSMQLVLSEVSGVKIGAMINHKDKNNCEGPDNEDNTGCSNGGYIFQDITEPVDLPANENSAALFDMIDRLRAMPIPGGQLNHSYQGKELFFELFRYLTGQGIYNGHVGFLDFVGKDDDGNKIGDDGVNLDDDFPEIAWDTAAEDGSGGYVTPLADASACARLFTVNFMFQVSQQEDDSDPAILKAKSNGGMDGITSDPTFDDVLGWLHDADLADGTYGSAPDLDGVQNVTSYFVVPESKINKTTTGYAKAGGTEHPFELTGDDPEKLVNTLRDILREILSTSTTFVAASIPVNVFNRAQVVDNVYLALFRADEDGRAWWNGNFKKLRLETETLADGSEQTKLVDSLDQEAIANDGRVKRSALTFWTEVNETEGENDFHRAINTDENEVDERDGRSVDLGAAGQQIPGFWENGTDEGSGPGETNSLGPRTVLYNDSSDNIAALDATSSLASELQSALDADSETEALELIKFARGMDIDDVDVDNDTTETREWIMGDPLHSRPLALNYGGLGSFDEDNPAIYLLGGSNDGHMRMIRNTESGGAQDGQEVWSFMPREVLDIQKELRANSSSSGHPYGVDGPPSAFVEDVNSDGTLSDGDGDKVHVFFGLRRGGRALYGLDVSIPNDPSLLWAKNAQDDSDYSNLGMTFARPRVGQMDHNGDNTNEPIVVVSGGYDPNKDDETQAPGTNDSHGNSVFVIDAGNGNVLHEFTHDDLDDSIPSTVTIFDSDSDGQTDRIYVGDTGGNVWRMDMFPATDDSQWKITHLAQLGRHFQDDIANDRRFFHRPDLVRSGDDVSGFDAVIIGSGDRADPLEKSGVTDNFLFMIKDRCTRDIDDCSADENDWPVTPPDLADITDNCLQDNSCGTNPDLENGWKLALDEAPGEKSLASPFTLGGEVLFTTFLPPGTIEETTCGPSEGSGLLYAISLEDGTATRNFSTLDGGDPEDPSSLTDADRSKLLKSGGIPSQVISIPPGKILTPDLTISNAAINTRWRSFWYRQTAE